MCIKKMRELLRLKEQISRDSRSACAFALNKIPESKSEVDDHSLIPEEQELIQIYKTLATTVWRMRNVIFDTETNEPKELLASKAVSKVAKYLESLEGALEDVHVQVKGDYAGHQYDEGDAVKVVTFINRQDLSRDEYVETLVPTVRWIDKKGNPRLLQQAEVVVGKAINTENT